MALGMAHGDGGFVVVKCGANDPFRCGCLHQYLVGSYVWRPVFVLEISVKRCAKFAFSAQGFLSAARDNFNGWRKRLCVCVEQQQHKTVTSGHCAKTSKVFTVVCQ